MLTKLLLTTLVVINNQPMSTDWQLPFAAPHRLVRPYLQPTSDYSAGHRGIDLEAHVGETVYAPADGVVRFVGNIVNRAVISLNHQADLLSEFEPVCSSLKAGERIKKGDSIGVLCTPDASYVPHCEHVSCLHFSIRAAGKYFSPQKLIGGLNPSRLLPYARG
jgi:murein DD-endopeptidase MepM/ murein hydrolase activator NlpD